MSENMPVDHIPGDDGPVPADRMVQFGEALGLGFKNYFQFEGRSSRGAFWWWNLCVILISFFATLIDMFVFPGMTAAEISPISTVWSLVTFIPGIAIFVRRLHDIGRSGWWYLLVFTIIGILLLIFWAAQPGQRAQNKYGPDREAGRA